MTELASPAPRSSSSVARAKRSNLHGAREQVVLAQPVVLDVHGSELFHVAAHGGGLGWVIRVQLGEQLLRGAEVLLHEEAVVLLAQRGEKHDVAREGNVAHLATEALAHDVRISPLDGWRHTGRWRRHVFAHEHEAAPHEELRWP